MRSVYNQVMGAEVAITYTCNVAYKSHITFSLWFIFAAKSNLVTTQITLNLINWAWWSPPRHKGKISPCWDFFKHLCTSERELEIERSIQAFPSIYPERINFKSHGWGPRSRKARRRCNLNSVTFSRFRNDGRPLIRWPDGEVSVCGLASHIIQGRSS